MEGLADIGRSAHDAIADRLLDRHGFAGQSRLIEDGQALYDRPIDWNDVTFSHHEAIARFDRVQAHVFEPAVSVSHSAARYAGEKRRHFTACTTLGKALEVLPARVHQGNHDGSEVFGKDQRREHRQRGHDIQAHVAAAQADDDLRRESDQDRDRSRGPYRASPIHPSGKLRHETDNKAGRRPCDDHRSKILSKICHRPNSLNRW
jgi:hypothetical protein